MIIAHTADIHIRSLSRHSEYRQTFKTFVDDCRSQRVDHIFLGGDIFHTKTSGISPEYIDLLTWWLNEMAAVAHVHVILGNHDGNIINLSRQDAVSPIVDAIGNSKIHLYKKSGVYEIEPGFNFCVFSIFDEEGWSNIQPKPGEVNIACYHGPVWGCKTESDWTIEDGHMIDFFKDYSFVMLGDIHKRQNLAFRKSKPIAAYPGTLIQQNYSEELIHGYLLWDIKSVDEWDVSFREMPNLLPFVTLNWDNSENDLLKEASSYPKGSRYRIKSEHHLSQDEMHRISEALKTAQQASEVTYRSDQQVNTQIVSTDTATLVKSDLRSPEVLVKLLKDHHANAVFTQTELDDITAQVKSYVTAVSTGDEVNRGSKWSLRHLKWDNVFVYGEDNVINFDKLNGIVGIFGPNRTGKSSIVGTIMYSLFNTTDRGSMKNLYVCNVRKMHCSSRMIISHDSVPYILERQTTKNVNKKGSVSASTALNLFRIRDDGEADDLCGEQRNDTEKTIRNLIGTADDFLMTSLSAQGESNQFISHGSTKRRAILSRFLDLDVFDKLYETANKDLSVLKAQLKNFPERDWDSDKQRLENNYKLLEERIKSLSKRVSDSQSELSLLRSELSMHNVKPVTQGDVDLQNSKITDMEISIKSSVEKLDNLKRSSEDIREKLVLVESILDKYDPESLKRQLTSQRTMEKSIIEIRHSLERETTLLAQQKKSLKILDEVPCGDTYPSCKFIKDAFDLKEKAPIQESKRQKIDKSLKEAEAALDNIRDDSLEEKLDKHTKALQLFSRLQAEMTKAAVDIEKLENSVKSQTDKLEEARDNLKSLQGALDNDENAEVVKIRSSIESILGKIKDWDDEKMQSYDDRGKLKASIDQLAEERQKRDELLTRMRLQEYITDAFNKKGIPLHVIKSQLPIINAEVSKILQGIVDFTIELENDEETDSLEIYINYGDSRRIVELCSGMEKTIASLALRVALINITSLPKSDVFIIDEGFGTLDSTGVEACNRLLASLKKFFRIVIVITHVDGIKDAVDHVIEITKREKDSRVEFA